MNPPPNHRIVTPEELREKGAREFPELRYRYKADDPTVLSWKKWQHGWEEPDAHDLEHLEFCYPSTAPAPTEKETEGERVHELKCWPIYFNAIEEGRKNFEWRKNDRDFQVGDVLLLREWSPAAKEYTGRTLKVDVTYILRGPDFYVPGDFCVLSISRRTPSREAVEDKPIPDEVFYSLLHREEPGGEWHKGESFECLRDAEIQMLRNARATDREYCIVEQRTTFAARQPKESVL